MTRVPLSTRLYNTAKPSTVLPKLPYTMTVGTYCQAVDILNPGCKIGEHIEEEARYYHRGKGARVCSLVDKAINQYIDQGYDIFLDLLVYPFLHVKHEPRKEGETDE